MPFAQEGIYFTFTNGMFKAISSSGTSGLFKLYATNLGGCPTSVPVQPVLIIGGTGSGWLVTSPLSGTNTTPNTAFATGPFDFNASTAAATPFLITDSSAQVYVNFSSGGGTLSGWLDGYLDRRLLVGS